MVWPAGPGLAWQAWSHGRRDLLPVLKIVPLGAYCRPKSRGVNKYSVSLAMAMHAAAVPVYKDKNQKVSARQVLDTDRDH